MPRKKYYLIYVMEWLCFMYISECADNNDTNNHCKTKRNTILDIYIFECFKSDECTCTPNKKLLQKTNIYEKK